jgi:SAM-dependent methyltransferase
MRGFHGHRWFAACWDWLTRHESPREREQRRRAAAACQGRVLELGAGVGANLPYLPAGTAWTGVEPDPHMLARARKRAAGGPRPVFVRAVAEALPFRDGAFDSVLVTLTLCSVIDPAAALRESKRVLKPGGTIAFFEHVRPRGRLPGRLFDLVTPAWKRIGGGCHPNRDTERAIASAGFEPVSIERLRLKGLPMIAGTAVRPQG